MKTAKAKEEASNTSLGALNDIFPISSRLNQRAGILEVLRSDGLRGPERQRGNGACRIVAWVLRESGRPHHKKVRNVPMLQVAVENAVPWVRTHDSAASVVR